jgi:hypothetical protein
MGVSDEQTGVVAAAINATVRVKPASSLLLAARRPRVWGDPVVRPVGFTLIAAPDPPSDPGEAILPPGGTDDEFATRLAAWLADVAMNEQGAA